MKILPTLKVFSKIFNIIHDDEITGKHHCYGITYHDNQDIYLRNRGVLFSEENEAEVFLHEVLHSIDGAFDIGLDESQVHLLSVGLFTVIRDNDLDFRVPKKKKK